VFLFSLQTLQAECAPLTRYHTPPSTATHAPYWIRYCTSLSPPVHPRDIIAWPSCGGLVTKSPSQTAIGEAGADQGARTGSWRGLVCRSDAGRTTRGGGHYASAPGICRGDAYAATHSTHWHVGCMAASTEETGVGVHLLMLKRRDMEERGRGGWRVANPAAGSPGHRKLRGFFCFFLLLFPLPLSTVSILL
jgi:hypothetical protein